jgi:hypothetical protein
MADPSVENEINNVLNTPVDNEKLPNSSNEKNKSNTKTAPLNKTLPKKVDNSKLAKIIGDHEMVVINKDFTDADLESLKKQLKEKGIDVKFKGVKRNSNNEITAIKIDVSSKKSNANYHTESEKAIRPIKIGFDTEGGSLSIGNSGEVHFSGDNAYSFVSKGGNHKIHTAGNADNVFVIAGDDDDEKIVIRKADKVHLSPKGKAHFVSEDDKVIKIEGKNIVITESKKGVMDTIHIKKMNKGKTVWVTKEDDHNVYEFDHDGKSKFFISTDGKESPLFILNGKEISKKEMDDLKPDSIDKIEVLKGDSATEKYGEKGKNGVVEITTKDKK